MMQAQPTVNDLQAQLEQLQRTLQNQSELNRELSEIQSTPDFFQFALQVLASSAPMVTELKKIALAAPTSPEGGGQSLSQLPDHAQIGWLFSCLCDALVDDKFYAGQDHAVNQSKILDLLITINATSADVGINHYVGLAAKGLAILADMFDGDDVLPLLSSLCQAISEIDDLSIVSFDLVVKILYQVIAKMSEPDKLRYPILAQLYELLDIGLSLHQALRASSTLDSTQAQQLIMKIIRQLTANQYAGHAQEFFDKLLTLNQTLADQVRKAKQLAEPNQVYDQLFVAFAAICEFCDEPLSPAQRSDALIAIKSAFALPEDLYLSGYQAYRPFMSALLTYSHPTNSRLKSIALCGIELFHLLDDIRYDSLQQGLLNFADRLQRVLSEEQQSQDKRIVYLSASLILLIRLANTKNGLLVDFSDQQPLERRAEHLNQLYAAIIAFSDTVKLGSLYNNVSVFIMSSALLSLPDIQSATPIKEKLANFLKVMKLATETSTEPAFESIRGYQKVIECLVESIAALLPLREKNILAFNLEEQFAVCSALDNLGQAYDQQVVTRTAWCGLLTAISYKRIEQSSEQANDPRTRIDTIADGFLVASVVMKNHHMVFATLIGRHFIPFAYRRVATRETNAAEIILTAVRQVIESSKHTLIAKLDEPFADFAPMRAMSILAVVLNGVSALERVVLPVLKNKKMIRIAIDSLANGLPDKAIPKIEEAATAAEFGNTKPLAGLLGGAKSHMAPDTSQQCQSLLQKLSQSAVKTVRSQLLGIVGGPAGAVSAVFGLLNLGVTIYYGWKTTQQLKQITAGQEQMQFSLNAVEGTLAKIESQVTQDLWIIQQGLHDTQQLIKTEFNFTQQQISDVHQEIIAQSVAILGESKAIRDIMLSQFEIVVIGNQKIQEAMAGNHAQVTEQLHRIEGAIDRNLLISQVNEITRSIGQIKMRLQGGIKYYQKHGGDQTVLSDLEKLRHLLVSDGAPTHGPIINGAIFFNPGRAQQSVFSDLFSPQGTAGMLGALEAYYDAKMSQPPSQRQCCLPHLYYWCQLSALLIQMTHLLIDSGCQHLVVQSCWGERYPNSFGKLFQQGLLIFDFLDKVSDRVFFKKLLDDCTQENSVALSQRVLATFSYLAGIPECETTRFFYSARPSGESRRQARVSLVLAKSYVEQYMPDYSNPAAIYGASQKMVLSILYRLKQIAMVVIPGCEQSLRAEIDKSRLHHYQHLRIPFSYNGNLIKRSAREAALERTLEAIREAVKAEGFARLTTREQQLLRQIITTTADLPSLVPGLIASDQAPGIATADRVQRAAVAGAAAEDVEAPPMPGAGL